MSNMSNMSKNNAQPIIPFEAASGALMILIVAAMAFIASFALAASLTATRLADGWNDGLVGSATVRIESLGADQMSRVMKAEDILRTTDGIIDVRTLSDAEVINLLEPWFGSVPELNDLPAPVILAVKIAPEREPDPSIVQARLDGAGIGAVYDNHGSWRARASDASGMIRLIGWTTALLAAIAIAATVFLVVRIAMAAHRETVSALRMAGAEDSYVAGLYQRRYFWLGLIGSAIGCILAAIIGIFFGAATKLSAALPGLSVPGYWPLGLLAVLIFISLICVLSARFAALSTLRNAP